MKKLSFLFCFILLASGLYAQVRVGVQVSPIFTVNRVEAASDTLALTPDGARLRVAAGPVFDFYLKENYYFSTGILYTPKIAGFDTEFSNNTDNQEVYTLQYFRIPLTLRLFTNEIGLDNRIYVQFGVSADIKIHDELIDGEQQLIENFAIADGSALVSIGLEHRIGYQTAVYGGFSYSRGLVNTVTDHEALEDDIASRNDIFSLDIGLFF
jgi:hypothetical protein